MKTGIKNMWTQSLGRTIKRLFAILILSSLSFSFSMAADWDIGGARQKVDSLAIVYQTRSEELDQPDSLANLGEYLRYAALNSPSLKAAFHGWNAALEKTGYAGALPDPMFTFGYFIENVETRVGPQEQRFSLKQAYPWFGTLGARKAVAGEAANVAFSKYQAEKLRLFYRVKSAYYRLYYLGREISLTRENMTLLSFWESVVRTKYKVALSQHPDVIKAQVELGKFEDKLASLEAMVKPVKAHLRASLNLPKSVYISLPSKVEISELPVNHDSVFARVVSENPDLEALQHVIEKERAGVRLANKSSWPNFTFGVDYIQTGAALNPSLTDSGKDPWGVNVGVNLPIWFGKNKAKKQEALARYRSSQNNLIEAENQAIAIAERILFEYDDALRKIRLYRDGLLPKAEQSLNASYTAYQAGKTDFLNILDAQRLLLEFELHLEKSIVDLATRKAELEMITGSEFEISLE
ncbi:MAG: TolC family protein [FCB group bacterium]|nr:TolC family protein [FCB group bacterium]